MHLHAPKPLLLAACALAMLGAHAQVINDPLDGAGDETYTGVNGFGAFNWVNALSFGFPTQEGSSAFLSNYTGFPLADIGMIKPFSTLMQNTAYRVSFQCSRYSSTYTLGLADYDTLYIGSRYGTMVWDTVPTPVNDFEWVRWSGVYTPAPVDIGEPFRFGFSLTLNSLTSFALDGPITATDLSTGITHRLDALEDVLVNAVDGASRIEVRSLRPLTAVELFDTRGARLAASMAGHGTTWSIATAGLASDLYLVRVRLADGSSRTRRVVLH